MIEFVSTTLDWLNKRQVADWISACVAVFALIAVGVEYTRQKRQAQIQAAIQVIDRMNDDPMADFAATVLDWGTGILVVPEPWRQVIGKSHIDWEILDIYDATRGTIQDTTKYNVTRLLYRHAFVALFNHFEHMGALLNAKVIRAKDLKSVSLLASAILKWGYSKQFPAEGFFDEALTIWYENGLPRKAIVAIAGA